MKEYKLVVNQDAVYKTTWHPRYVVPGELETMPQPSTLPGAVVECGKWYSSVEAACKTDEFPCLFNIKEGKLYFLLIATCTTCLDANVLIY